MLGATAPVAGSDTGRRGQGAARPAYPGLAQRRKDSDLRSSEGSLPLGRKQFEPDPFGLACCEGLIQTMELECQPAMLSQTWSGLPVLCLLTLWPASIWIWRNCELILCVIKRVVDRPHRDGLVRWHLRPLMYRSLQGLLVGNNTDKFLTLLSCPKDGTTPRPPYNCSLTWKVMCWTLLSWSPNEPRRLVWLAHFQLITGLREG